MERSSSVYNRASLKNIISKVTALDCIRFLIVADIILKISRTIGILLILYAKRNQKSKMQLKIFLYGYAILGVIKGIIYYLKNRQFLRITRIGDFENNEELSGINSLVEVCGLFWYLIGINWIMDCTDCANTDWLLYKTCVWLIFIGCAAFIAPLIAIVALLVLASWLRPNLKVIIYESSDDVKNRNSMCTICFSEYQKGCKVKFLPCEHHFHNDCIEEWFHIKDTCPLCNSHVNILYDLIGSGSFEV